MSEILVPAVMMLTLSMVHSQIVSTNSGPIISNNFERQRNRRARQGRARLNKKIRRSMRKFFYSRNINKKTIDTELKQNHLVKFKVKLMIQKLLLIQTQIK